MDYRLWLIGAALTAHAVRVPGVSHSFQNTPAHSGVHRTVYTPPPPAFHLGWKEEIAEPARSAAVGDVTGDGKPRLVLLVEKPQRNQATLLVQKWSGTAFTTEFTGDVMAAPDKLAVGRFAGPDKPAMIVTGDALWSWNGTTFVRKPAPMPVAVFGAAKMKSGGERLIVSEGAKEFKSYMVDPQAANDWMTDRTDYPKSSEVTWEGMRATSAFFKQMGMPAEFGDGGLITLWDPHKANSPLLFYARLERQIDPRTGAGTDKINSYIDFRDPTNPNGPVLWTTQKLNGAAYNIALSDAKVASKPGLLILTSDATNGKSRTLYFYAMD